MGCELEGKGIIFRELPSVQSLLSGITYNVGGIIAHGATCYSQK